MVVFGTRPEAIKLAPVVKALIATPGIATSVCLTGQHREMVDPVISFFGITADDDLDVMRPNQSITDVTARVLEGMGALLDRRRPDWVIVQGDTTTAFAVALASFYRQIKVAHVEAGLRTGQRYAPFPEEMNRTLIARLADLHFAPTVAARDNLLREGVPAASIGVVGNTGVDALLMARERLREPTLEATVRASLPAGITERRFILVTGHRRESFGEPYREFCAALRAIAETEDVDIIFPVHLNPTVQTPVTEILGNSPRVHLLDPVSYPTLIFLASRCHFVITDSGGIQEEAASLGKPVLVTRDATERMESVAAGISRLVGTSAAAIRQASHELLTDRAAYVAMARPLSLYGDGRAAAQIAARLSRG